MTSKQIDWLEKIPVDGKERTAKEWYSYLPEPERSIVLKHANNMEFMECRLSDCLSVAFIWSDVPKYTKTFNKTHWKQQERWDKLHTMIRNHEQKFLTTVENSEK